MRLTSLAMSAGLVAALLSSAGFSQAPPPQQPVYILLTLDVGDFINWNMSGERLRRTLPAIEKFRKIDPSLSAAAYFSGAMSDALARKNAEDHLLDEVKDYVRRGVIEPGYDGFDEPTYESHPKVIFGQNTTAQDRWQVRMRSAAELMSQARDPKTGQPIARQTGAIREMQEVFGPAAAIRGIVLEMPNLWGAVEEVGDDGEIVNTLRRINSSAVLAGLNESDLGHSSGSMFRPWANDFSKLMSPEPKASPEVFWQENVLRFSETSMQDWRTFHAEDGVAALKKVMAALDRSRIRVLHIEVGGQRIYVKPPAPPAMRITLPLQWAYSHPDHPQFPDKLTFSRQEIDARYAAQDEVLKYLASEFVPANAGSRFVSPQTLKQMAGPGYDYDVAFGDLRDSVSRMVAAWGEKPTPPAFLKVGARYLSLADLFEVLADSLAQRHETGRFPDSVRVGRVFAPVSMESPKQPLTGEVRARTVGEACSQLLPALRDDTWSEIPRNAIPSPIQIDGMPLTAAQFLRLMADALLASGEQAKLTVKTEDMFAGRVMTFYTRRLFSDLGAPWTYKPAVLAAAAESK